MPFSVLLVGIDGLGGTYLEDSRNNWPFRMPFLHSLFCKATAAAARQPQHQPLHDSQHHRDGFATLAATTVFPPTSAPAWSSALTGMTPDQTGIVDKCLSGPSGGLSSSATHHCEISPPLGCCTVTRRSCEDDPHAILSHSLRHGNNLPHTVFDVLPADRWCRGMYSSWSWLANFVDSCMLDDVVNGHGNDDMVVCKYAQQMGSIDDACGKPNALCMVHLDGVDAAGHRHGWGSEEYMASWTTADDHLKTIVSLASDHASRKGRQLITVVVSDHGGSERDHGQMLQSHMRIPLVVLRENTGSATDAHHRYSRRKEDDAADCACEEVGMDAATGAHRVASIIDVAPTILGLVGLAIPRWMRGTPLIAPCPSPSHACV